MHTHRLIMHYVNKSYRKQQRHQALGWPITRTSSCQLLSMALSLASRQLWSALPTLWPTGSSTSSPWTRSYEQSRSNLPSWSMSWSHRCSWHGTIKITLPFTFLGTLLGSNQSFDKSLLNAGLLLDVVYVESMVGLINWLVNISWAGIAPALWKTFVEC